VGSISYESIRWCLRQNDRAENSAAGAATPRAQYAAPQIVYGHPRIAPTPIPSKAPLERNAVTSAVLDHEEADFHF